MGLKRKILAFFFGERCPYCGALIEPEETACDNCKNVLDEKQRPIICGALGYRCVSSFVYAGAARRMLRRIKFRGRIQHIPQAAVILAKDIENYYGEGAFDLVTFVPMHPVEQEKRGFNQSELIAAEISRILRLPSEETLLKIKRTKQQRTLRYKERKTNLNGAFKVKDPKLIHGMRILIIDDITTSGITLGKCCKTLSRSKPSLICCAALAKTEFNISLGAVI